MTKVDPSKEAERLKALYGGMEDSELSTIAVDANSLTDIARQVLSEEMARRSMEPPPPPVPPISKPDREPIRPSPS